MQDPSNIQIASTIMNMLNEMFEKASNSEGSHDPEKLKYIKEICGKIHSQMKHPYLKALMSFLSTYVLRCLKSRNSEIGLGSFTKQEGIDFFDRIAFACRFIPRKEVPHFNKRVVGAAYKSLSP